MKPNFYMINIYMCTRYSVWIRLELSGLDYDYKLIVENQFINQWIFSNKIIIKSKKIIKHEIT
jgi:hypothetical protein